MSNICRFSSRVALSPTFPLLDLASFDRFRRKFLALSISAFFAAGTLVDGRKLTEEGGKRLSNMAGKISVVDGPYAEAKEVVGGVFMIRAKDYNEATEIAKTCPHIQFGRIDVRQIDFMGQPET